MANQWYRENYLKSEDWKNLRAAMLAHRDHKCEACGDGKSLDVHHRRYRNLYDVKSKDLRVLCRNCHDRIHKLMELEPSLKRQWGGSDHHNLAKFSMPTDEIIDQIEEAEDQYVICTEREFTNCYDVHKLMRRRVTLFKTAIGQNRLIKKFPAIAKMLELTSIPSQYLLFGNKACSLNNS